MIDVSHVTVMLLLFLTFLMFMIMLGNGAEALKKEGNVAFMQKNFEVADAKYTEALKHDATNKFVLGNRSAARRHLKDFSGALSDATAAVSHAPEWPKVCTKRAMCQSV